MNILTANLVFSTLVFWVAARIYGSDHGPGVLDPRILGSRVVGTHYITFVILGKYRTR